MTACTETIQIQSQRHLIEQYAYESIRRFLSSQFILDPVLFMHTHGKRPEDLNGAQLRVYYPTALTQGLTLDNDAPLGLKQRFMAGKFFTIG